MALIRHRALQHDEWQPEAQAAGGDLRVPLARWREEREALLRRPGRLGLVLDSREDLATPPHQLAEELAADLPRLALIELRFAAFNDGRPFSQARVLRERFGFRGELRASGELLADQLRELERCGFDAIDYASADDARQALVMAGDVDVALQPAGDDTELVFRRRRRAPLSLVR